MRALLVAAVAALTWDDAHAAAARTVANLTKAEIAGLLRGTGWRGIIPELPGPLEKWHYIGNLPGAPGVPALAMQDASAGFRTFFPESIGTVTAWPSMLALAATWDEALVERVAAAIGAEFAAKGANVVLGPGLNVHRSPLGGRNWEYLSGEDPVLGARLAARYVKGVQSQNVLAVMKHFAFNQQETERASVSSDVAEKVAFELYYPPFKAAVDAGVGAVMCAYNKANGTKSCGNSDLLQRDLRGRLGFRGFVM